MTDVDVCIATFRRPDWLRQLLQGIAAQHAPALRLRVIVVDNDELSSAASVVAKFAHQLLRVEYHTQPVKNIALTRNLALDQCEAPWVVLVDDDEIVPPGWLQTLMDCQQRFSADVVVGPVKGLLLPEAPGWARQGGFFAPEPQPTGTLLPWAASGNVLMRGEIVRAGARFDPRFGLTGGEDTNFFYRLAQQGRRLVWCQEAEIAERVPANRTTAVWLLRRFFRGGQAFADIVSRPQGWPARLGWATWRLMLLLVAGLLTVLSLPLGPGVALRFAGKVASNAGQLSTLLAYRLQEYR